VAHVELQQRQRGACVEVSAGEVAGRRLVRDSKDPDGAVLALAPRHWRAFIAGMKAGGLSLTCPAPGRNQ
jgi:hypothetical protein